MTLLIYENGKRKTKVLNDLARFWIQERHEAKQFAFPSMKEFTKVQEPRLSFAVSSTSVGHIKRLNGILVFPTVRRASPEDEAMIESFDNSIKHLHEKKEAYIEDHFQTWDFLSLPEAEDIVGINKPVDYESKVIKVIGQIEGKDKSFKPLRK